MNVFVAWGLYSDGSGVEVFGVATNYAGAASIIGTLVIERGGALPSDLHIDEFQLQDVANLIPPRNGMETPA